MAHSVPPLPYDYNALEPHIDEQTMRIHHDKHHAAYVNNLNAALEKHPELQNKSAEDLIKDINSIPEAIRGAVRNNGGGHVNHTMFWEIMGPGKGGEPTGTIGDAIKSTFGELRHLQDAAQRRRRQALRQRLGVADRRRRQAGDREHRQPGQPDDGRQEAHLRRGRVGARLLPEVPEPPPRLPRGVVERHQLGRGQQALRESNQAIAFIRSSCVGYSFWLSPMKEYPMLPSSSIRNTAGRAIFSASSPIRCHTRTPSPCRGARRSGCRTEVPSLRCSGGPRRDSAEERRPPVPLWRCRRRCCWQAHRTGGGSSVTRCRGGTPAARVRAPAGRAANGRVPSDPGPETGRRVRSDLCIRTASLPQVRRLRRYRSAPESRCSRRPATCW